MERFDAGSAIRVCIWRASHCMDIKRLCTKSVPAYTTRFPRLSDLPSSYDRCLSSFQPRRESASFFGNSFCPVPFLFPSIFKRNLYLRVYRSRENCCAFETKHVIFFRFQKYLDFRFLFNREKERDIIRISPIKLDECMLEYL